MEKVEYMRPLSNIAIDIIEALAYGDLRKVSEYQKAVEFRIDALAVGGNTHDEEKRLVRVLKQIKMEGLGL